MWLEWIQDVKAISHDPGNRERIKTLYLEAAEDYLCKLNHCGSSTSIMQLMKLIIDNPAIQFLSYSYLEVICRLCHFKLQG
jgi:hypothetical protein